MIFTLYLAGFTAYIELAIIKAINGKKNLKAHTLHNEIKDTKLSGKSKYKNEI